MTPQQYESLTAEVNAAHAEAMSIAPRHIAGEKWTDAEIAAVMERYKAAGQALYDAALAIDAMPVARHGRMVR